MNVKSLSDIEIKNADEGTVSAVFATLNVVDSDGDVTLPGAFTDGAEVRISAYGHQSWQGALPVGKGTIREEGDSAIFEGSFFLDTTPGRDTFNTVKNLGPIGEWSYSLHDVVSERGEFEGQEVNYLKRIRVHEVSPVLMGAGVGTRTLVAKSTEQFSEHARLVFADMDEFIKRFEEVIAFRTEQGKSRLSEHSVELLDEAGEALKRLTALREPAAPPKSRVDLEREFARYVAISQGATQ